MKYSKPTLIFCLATCMWACFPTPKKGITTTTTQKFAAPIPPAVLTSSEARAEFVAMHYWDNFNFSDTSLINKADYTEQAFADYVAILPNMSMPLLEKSVEVLMNKALADSLMYVHFITLSEKYLYDPNSPLRNENIYIAVLQNIVANPKLDELQKARFRYQLQLALKNRVGDKAIDFKYTTESGDKSTLYVAKGDPLLLFFFRPDCPSCKETKEYIAKNGLDMKVNILYVNPDLDTHLEELYDLRASPTLYLLSSSKTVLLKDAQIEQIDAYISSIY